MDNFVWIDGFTTLDRYEGLCYPIKTVVEEENQYIAYVAYALELLKKVLLRTYLLLMRVKLIRMHSFPSFQNTSISTFYQLVLTIHFMVGTFVQIHWENRKPYFFFIKNPRIKPTYIQFLGIHLV